MRPFQVAWLFVRRFFFHLTLRYRTTPPRLRVADPDLESKKSHAEGPSSSRTHAVLTMSSSETADLNSERSMHADHSETVVDQTPPLGTKTHSAVAEKKTSRLLAQSKHAFRTRPNSPAKTRTDDLAESETEDDEAGWVTAYFGPASPRRNLWLFVGSTGLVGLILAIILLFNGKAPEEARIASTPKNDSKPLLDPVEEKPPQEPAEDPFNVEPVLEPEAPPFVEVKPEPEKPLVVEVTPEPEPEPPPVVDDVSVEVFLLPAPDPNQGEQFEVKAGDEPLDPNAGFADLKKSDWQKANLLSNKPTDAWSELQKLVPLEPFGPQDTVTPPAVSKRSFTADFVTTQPRSAAQSLLMPYELTVTNTGAATLDRVVLEQTLPASITLRDTTAVHAAEDRTLRWEYEGLRPQGMWNIPVVTVPTQQGQITLPTTLTVGSSVSSQTLVQTPDIKLAMTCQPAAKYKKYHQIVFQITNTGEVPLQNLLMDIHLTGNLWHRFGQDFEFFHKQLEVGKTHEALLHVKTEQLGGAQLQAELVTDEGAAASGHCQFTVVGNGEIESQNIPVQPAAEASGEETSPKREREWNPRPDSEPRLVPDAEDPFSLPSPRPANEPRAKPVSQPKTLKEASEADPAEKPAPVKEAPIRKPETKPVDDFPAFPGEIGPLPERKPVVPPKQPLETESTKESPFDRPVEKKKETEKPAEDPFGPVEDDPFAKKEEPGFFGDE